MQRIHQPVLGIEVAAKEAYNELLEDEDREENKDLEDLEVVIDDEVIHALAEELSLGSEKLLTGENRIIWPRRIGHFHVTSTAIITASTRMAIHIIRVFFMKEREDGSSLYPLIMVV